MPELEYKTRNKEPETRNVETGTIRVLPLAIADGPWNMAADEVMLESAVAGLAALRFYAWAPPTLSLGYFQRHEERLRHPALAALPWVRRATGGGAIEHDGDLTYAIALPAAIRKGRTPAEWHCRLHQVLADLLRRRGIAVEVMAGPRPTRAQLPYSCFAVPQPGDVVLNGRKVIGAAQRVRLGAVLQHGSIQLANLASFADELAGGMAAALNLVAQSDSWSPDELARIQRLVSTRYGHKDWNQRR